MPEEACDVSEAIGLISVNCSVIVAERLLEAIVPDTIEFAEPFTDETIESRVGALLRATLDDHVAKLDLCEFMR